MKLVLRQPFPEAEASFVLDGRTVEFSEGLKTDSFTHTLHRFPGKFVPQVARELLRLVGGETGTIIDPFCGSGTTLIEAATLGRASYGADFDPLAVFISQAKVTPLGQRELIALRSYWQDILRSRDLPDGAIPPLPNLSHWFTNEAVAELSGLKAAALALPNLKLQVFSLAVLSSIIRRVSNADDQTQKTYVSHTLKKNPPRPVELFPTLLDRALRGISAFSIACKSTPTVSRGDARRMDLERRHFSGVVTSPPYIDSIDYVYNQMLEYYWLWDVVGLSSIDHVKTLRREPMGFAKPAASMETLSTVAPTATEELRPVLTAITKKSAAEGENVLSYFVDFRRHLEATKEVLRRRSMYGLVVGESVIRSVTVPTPKILIKMFRDVGFDFVGSCTYTIKRHYMKFPRRSNSGKITVDHVLCFRTP